MLKHLIAAAAACLFVGGAQAADTLSWNADGTLNIDSVVVAVNGCYYAGKPHQGTPAGERQIRNAVPVIYPVKHTGAAVCTMELKVLKFSMTMKVPAGAQAVIVYAIDEAANSVVPRALALPPRKGVTL